MSFITSVFSCCFGSSENEKAEADARRARIEIIYTNGSDSPESIITAPPPCYADIAYDRPFVATDEKNPPAPEVPQPQYPSEARRSSVSSGSSVVSVPSTRLSDLTSLRTGTTRRNQNRDRDEMSENNDTWSESGYPGLHDNAPPSYYAGSERSITPIPSPPPAHVAQHPVMQDGWLEGLRLNVERDRLWQQYMNNRSVPG